MMSSRQVSPIISSSCLSGITSQTSLTGPIRLCFKVLRFSTEVNFNPLQLWEETEADNRRLMLEMTRVRGELQETKYMMEETRSKVSDTRVRL